MSFSDRNPKDPSIPKAHNPGPTSEAGKEKSSKNALKHGCCSTETVLLSTDNPEDFKALEQIWCRAYAPTTEPERKLVQEIVLADWFAQRATRTYAKIESDLLVEEPNPLRWSEAQQRTLGRFLRYKTTHTNNFIKAKKSMEDYRKIRATEKANLEKKKAKTEPNWKEHLENMKQQAINLGFAQQEFTPHKS